MRIPDASRGELDIGGKPLLLFEHPQLDTLSEVEKAAIIASLKSHADALEETELDRPVREILEESSHSFEIVDYDNGSNVSE